VFKGFEWIEKNLPEIIRDVPNVRWQLQHNHDASKNDPEEYAPYDAYFYGNNRSSYVVQNFREAWLRHIHKNPHHWQHWVLINDDPKEGEIILDMPHIYIIEMICDWWAFSWNKGNLYEIFDWYDEHNEYTKLSDSTRKTVEDILYKIKAKIKEVDATCQG
jgi:hypothetical protein